MLTGAALIASSAAGIEFGLPTFVAGLATVAVVLAIKREEPWATLKGFSMKARLRVDLVNPYLAAAVSFALIGFVFLILFMVLPSPLPTLDDLVHGAGMHDDPPMIDEPCARYRPRFERRWRLAEFVDRGVMLVIVAATLVGLLGGGPVTVWTRTVSGEGLSVTFPTIARFGTPGGLDITAAVPRDAGTAAITLPDAIAAEFHLRSVTPLAGPPQLSAQLDGRPPLAWTQFVMP